MMMHLLRQWFQGLIKQCINRTAGKYLLDITEDSLLVLTPHPLFAIDQQLSIAE